MITNLSRVLTGLLFVACIGQESRGQVVESRDFKPDPFGRTGETRYDNVIDIGLGIRLPISIEVTVRENGTLRVANLSLRVVDGYDDGLSYEGRLLHVEFVDVTGDGYKDLVITGIVVHTGEKEGDPVSRESVTAIYVFVPEKREFRQTFQHGPKLDMHQFEPNRPLSP